MVQKNVKELQMRKNLRKENIVEEAEIEKSSNDRAHHERRGIAKEYFKG